MPQLGAQARWLSTRSHTLATRHRLSCPKPLLDTLAKQGRFGLLPAKATADLQSFVLPVIYGGVGIEPSVSARVLPSTYVELEAGSPFEYARFPAGLQFHYLPFLDVVCAW
jgi:hypothetical protein